MEVLTGRIQGDVRESSTILDRVGGVTGLAADALLMPSKNLQLPADKKTGAVRRLKSFGLRI